MKCGAASNKADSVEADAAAVKAPVNNEMLEKKIE
jgi:hypothetical protein